MLALVLGPFATAPPFAATIGSFTRTVAWTSTTSGARTGSGRSASGQVGSSVSATGLVRVPPLHFAASLLALPMMLRTRRTVSLQAPSPFNWRKHRSPSKALRAAIRPTVVLPALDRVVDRRRRSPSPVLLLGDGGRSAALDGDESGELAFCCPLGAPEHDAALLRTTAVVTTDEHAQFPGVGAPVFALTNGSGHRCPYMFSCPSQSRRDRGSSREGPIDTKPLTWTCMVEVMGLCPNPSWPADLG